MDTERALAEQLKREKTQYKLLLDQKSVSLDFYKQLDRFRYNYEQLVLKRNITMEQKNAFEKEMDQLVEPLAELEETEHVREIVQETKRTMNVMLNMISQLYEITKERDSLIKTHQEEKQVSDEYQMLLKKSTDKVEELTVQLVELKQQNVQKIRQMAEKFQKDKLFYETEFQTKVASLTEKLQTTEKSLEASRNTVKTFGTGSQQSKIQSETVQSKLQERITVLEAEKVETQRVLDELKSSHQSNLASLEQTHKSSLEQLKQTYSQSEAQLKSTFQEQTEEKLNSQRIMINDINKIAVDKLKNRIQQIESNIKVIQLEKQTAEQKNTQFEQTIALLREQMQTKEESDRVECEKSISTLTQAHESSTSQLKTRHDSTLTTLQEELESLKKEKQEQDLIIHSLNLEKAKRAPVEEEEKKSSRVEEKKSSEEQLTELKVALTRKPYDFERIKRLTQSVYEEQPESLEREMKKILVLELNTELHKFFYEEQFNGRQTFKLIQSETECPFVPLTMDSKKPIKDKGTYVLSLRDGVYNPGPLIRCKSSIDYMSFLEQAPAIKEKLVAFYEKL